MTLEVAPELTKHHLNKIRDAAKKGITDGNYWQNHLKTSDLHAWQGIAYERVAMHHIESIKKALGIDTASGRPNRDKVGQLTQAQVREIATAKMPDLNAASIEAAMSMVKGTARSMGVTVADE